MACTLEELQRDGLDIIKGKIRGKSTSMRERDGLMFYDLSRSKRVRDKTSAWKALTDRKKVADDWIKEEGYERYGSWATIRDMGTNYGIEVRMPPLLKRAYTKKHKNDRRNILENIQAVESANEYVYGGVVYPSLDDMQAAMAKDSDYMPSNRSDYSVTNFADYLARKKKILKKVELRIATLTARRRYQGNKEIRAELVKVRELSKRLEAEVKDLENSSTIFESTVSQMFNNDLSLLDNLLAGDRPLIEDIHTAEYLMSYLDLISDYSSENSANEFVDTRDPSLIDPQIKDVLDRLSSKLTDYRTKIDKAKKGYLLDLIKNSPKIRSLYPQKQAEQIMEDMLASTDDIGFMSQLFGTIDKTFTKEDSLLAQLIRDEMDASRGTAKSYAAQQAQRIDDLLPRVQKALGKMGYDLLWSPISRVFSKVNYDIFYQQSEAGNRTGRLIQPYADKWFKYQANFFSRNNKEYWDAVYDKDAKKMNESLVNKYNWINDNANFLDITKIPELAGDARFSRFADKFSPDADYRQQVIDQIGQYGYDRLVEEQAEKIEDWMDTTMYEISTTLDSHGVSRVEELPDRVQHILNITLVRNSPFSAIESHKTGQQGRVDYINDNQSNQYQSHLKYNTFYPKEQVTRINPKTGEKILRDGGFYDERFDVIKGNKDLLEFWEVLQDSTVFMNSTLSDASKMLVHNSLPAMQKFPTDILLDKEMSIATKFSTLMSHTRDYIGDIFSINQNAISAKDRETINNSKMQFIQDRVGMAYKTALLELKHQKGGAPISKAEGAKLRDEVTNELVMEQAFNLPVIMKAYLDMTAEYKAQRDSLPKISVYKSLYENIQLGEKSSIFPDGLIKVVDPVVARMRRSGIQDKRVRSNKRMNHWFTKNLLNAEDKEVWHNFGKFYNSQERAFKKALEAEIGRLEELSEDLSSVLSDPNQTDDEKAKAASTLKRVDGELSKLRSDLENLGKSVVLAEMYNFMFNKLQVFLGLGFNIPTNVFNWVQGWVAGTINDVGKYWTAGNFSQTHSFVNRIALRHAFGGHSYKQEFQKAQLMMGKLGIIQDATNELDRARNASGFSGMAKKLSPYYLIELTEWHNQTPQILAMLMDQTITDKDGNQVQVFNGESFPAHRIDERTGELMLKPEFATENNIGDWQNFSSQTASFTKNYMSGVIGILNGDYSRTGTLYAKKALVARTFMTFKTWLPNQMWQRFAYNQKSLALGQDRFDGFYTGTYTSPKTTVAATGLIAGSFMVAGTMGLGMLLGPLLAGATVAGGAYMVGKAKFSGSEELKVGAQLAETGLALVKRIIGIPTNMVSGKQVIKQHEFNRLNLNKRELDNLNILISETATVLLMALLKVIWKSMMAPNDEEEPKTLDGKIKNPYYGKTRRTEQEKEFYNYVENALTRMIEDVTIYRDPENLWETASGSGIQGWFTRVKALAGAIHRKWQGLDELQSGPNAGESNLYNQLQKNLLPSFLRKGAGFGSMMQRDFNPDEMMDSWFYTDYKKDRKIRKSVRDSEKRKLTRYWQEQYNYKDLSEEDRILLDDFIKKKVNEEVKHIAPYYPRYLYDEDQERIPGTKENFEFHDRLLE